MLHTSPRKVLGFLAIPVWGIVLSGSTAANDQTVFVAPGFASCGVSISCPPLPPCEALGLDLDGTCSEECFVTEGPGACAGFTHGSTSMDTWELDGDFSAFTSSGGDTPDVDVRFDVSGTRPAPEQLELNGGVKNFSHTEFGEGQIEVSVFRFSGDPTVFDGVQVPSVFTLVDLGLIDAEDVLFSEFIAIPSPRDEELEFNYTVDVTGIPDEEIVVFGSHSGSSVNVPALSLWSFLLLASGMFLVPAWMLTRSR